ncbi:hypothetical protein QQZ08_001879 [Neonectria magnoliae]|uniref:FAD-binding domain-containing protein n=1 Tax=Neonectria magnoliae TaxID=2732573 RepID=A0ABR1IF25_9HYPO
MVQRQGNGWHRVYFRIRVPELYIGKTIDLTNIDATRNALLSSFTPIGPTSSRNFYAPSITSDIGRSFTLGGDEVHLALPNGEGVNCATKDALELASRIEVAGLQNLDVAVREYERELLVRGKAHIEDGMQLEQLLAADGGPTEVIKFFQQHDKEEDS